MWLFTIHGFYSVVSAGDGAVQVRARNIQHLRNLKDRIPAIQRAQIRTDERGDYFARIILPAEKWRIVASYLMDEVVKYSNYKAELEKTAGNRENSDRSGRLMDWVHATWQGGASYQKLIGGGGAADEEQGDADDGEPKRGRGSESGRRLGGKLNREKYSRF